MSETNGEEIQQYQVHPLYLTLEDPPWVIPPEIQGGFATKIALQVESITVAPLSGLKTITPKPLMDAMQEILGNAELLDHIYLQAAKSYTEIKSRLERTHRYRERLINHEMTSDYVRNSGYTSRAERLILAEQTVEEIRQEVQGDTGLVALRDHEIALAHLENVWRDLKKDLESKQRRLKMADQMAKTAQKIMANHGMKSLLEEESTVTVERLMQEYEAEQEQLAQQQGPADTGQ